MFQDLKPLLDSLLEAFVEAGFDKSHELLAAHQAALEGLAAMGRHSVVDAVAHWLPAQVLPPARSLADALLAWWRRPEAQPEAALEVAQAAAARSCAYLRCANLGGEGGPAAVCAMHARLHMGRRCCVASCSLCGSLPTLQRLPSGVVLRHCLLPRRLAGGAPPRVQGAGRGAGGREGAAAAGGG